MPKQSNKTINYSVYYRDPNKNGGKPQYVNDTSNLQLPSIEALTDTLKGAGILGEVDMPTPGQVGSMTFTMSIRTSNEDMGYLMRPGVIDLEVRWAVDRFDPSLEKNEQVANKAFLKCLCKKADEGKIEANAAADGSFEYEVIAYQRIMNGKEILHIHKFNGDYTVNGVDYAKDIKAAL
ncbi:MAG: phage major tail tube protein [Clostridiales bacterium]|jgi:phage tail tube protein FII|nr:phage major tail tube protein [Eubacteriales bacterium]MDH7566858.1 phage major tail tube protein [Clostridiales bacterium]